MYHIQFAWIMRLKFKPEPEPGQSEGSGSCQVPRLQAAPAPKPCVLVWKLSWDEPSLGLTMNPVLVWALSWYENYEPFPSMSPVLVRTQSCCEPCPDLNPVLMWTLSGFEPRPDVNPVLVWTLSWYELCPGPCRNPVLPILISLLLYGKACIYQMDHDLIFSWFTKCIVDLEPDTQKQLFRSEII